ncbi:MAG TPA: hypothetical protein VFI42_08050 [Thermomicrobiaceae bacterium]|nr:hypothetical protein [Thermomicrobiaceae bacterium]
MTTRVGKRRIDGRTFWYVAWESANGRSTLYWYVDSRDEANQVRQHLTAWEGRSDGAALPLAAD